MLVDARRFGLSDCFPQNSQFSSLHVHQFAHLLRATASAFPSQTQLPANIDTNGCSTFATRFDSSLTSHFATLIDALFQCRHAGFKCACFQRAAVSLHKSHDMRALLRGQVTSRHSVQNRARCLGCIGC